MGPEAWPGWRGANLAGLGQRREVKMERETPLLECVCSLVLTVVLLSRAQKLALFNAFQCFSEIFGGSR